MRERGRRRMKSRKEISYINRRKFVEELYYIDYLLTMFDLHGLAQGLFKLLLNHSIYRKKIITVYTGTLSTSKCSTFTDRVLWLSFVR